MAAPQASAHHCTVQKGESIWRIAEEYHLDFAKLLELNRHLADPHLVHPDQKINTHADHGVGNDHSPSSSNGSAQSKVSQDEQIESNDQAQQVLALVNAERAKAGLESLKLDDSLNVMAAAKAKDMAESNYFSHNSPNYGSPFDMMRSFGIDYTSAGENIAAGQKTAKDVMNSWMNSSGHRANILSDKYTELGVGYYAGGSYGVYWCQEFTQ